MHLAVLLRGDGHPFQRCSVALMELNHATLGCLLLPSFFEWGKKEAVPNPADIGAIAVT